MFELIREHQLNIMIFLCGGCGFLAFLLFNTRFISASRKRILIFMEAVAFFLLWFDRLAYVYAGDISPKAYIMVRVSNFFVFFLTSGIVFGFNLYVSDLLMNEGKFDSLPRRLRFVGAMTSLGMVMAVVSAFTDFYYYFDETNRYHRGQGFLIAYIIPVLCPIIQYTVIRQYKKAFSRLIYISLVLYIFVPISCGILQIFLYGISIVNMAMVAVSISLYIFTYLDINNTVRRAHEIEIRNMQGEQDRMQRLFDQTATAFVSAVEKRDELTKGSSIRVAEYAKEIARLAGKNDDECEEVYYAALLHDIGLIGMPDEVVRNEDDPEKADMTTLRKKPLIGEEILSSITEYPYLSQGARYSHERYDGTGYPEGLKGEEIPEIARIIAVADAFVSMTSRNRYRDAIPLFLVREAFVKGSGDEYDPAFADIMVRIIDSGTGAPGVDGDDAPETELTCKEYRENVMRGIMVESNVLKITFDCEALTGGSNGFSSPSVVLFDAYDGRVHDDEKSIDAYHYLEYGEIWFDKYSVTTEARSIEEKRIEDKTEKAAEGGDISRYSITAGRYEDHLKLVMKSNDYEKEVIVALPSVTKASFIGLTGENCRIFNVMTEPTGETVGPGDIPRIVQPVSYIDHMESDLKNVQIDKTRSAYTESVEVKGKFKLCFHTMSLPAAELVWDCPYVILFSSDDGRVGGDNYLEYQEIKLNGEDNGDQTHVKNRFLMKREPEFPGWEKWKEKNRDGLDCEVSVERKGDRVIIRTDNVGINIENTTSGIDEKTKVYVALTGDTIALTDIRIV